MERTRGRATRRSRRQGRPGQLGQETQGGCIGAKGEADSDGLKVRRIQLGRELVEGLEMMDLDAERWALDGCRAAGRNGISRRKRDGCLGALLPYSLYA